MRSAKLIDPLCGSPEKEKTLEELGHYTSTPGIDLTKRKSDMHFFELQVETKKNFKN